MDAMTPFERQLTTLHPDFVMWQYKISPCPNPHGHSAEDCVWAHPEDHHRRRSPHLYTAEYCKFMRSKHVCCAGDACPKAHTLLEYRLHPARFRTERCRYGTRAQCPNAVCFFAHTDAELRAAPAPLMVLNGSGGMVAAGAPAGLQAWAAPEGLPQGQGALGGFPPGLRQQEPLQQQQLLFQQFSQLGMAPQQQQPAAMNGNNMVVLSPSTGLQMVQGGQGLLLPSMPLAAAGPAHQFAGLPADAAAAAAGMGGGAYMPGMAAAPPTAFGPAATGSGQMLVVMGSQASAPCHPLPLSGLGTTASLLQQQPFQQLPVTLAPGVTSQASGPQLLQGPLAAGAPLLAGAPLSLQAPGAPWGTHPAHLQGLASSTLGAAVAVAQNEATGPLAVAQLPPASATAVGAGMVGAGGGSPGMLSSSQAPDSERLGDVLQMMLAHFKPAELRSLHASLGHSLQKDGLVV